VERIDVVEQRECVPDRVIAGLADGQQGRVARWQLLPRGITPAAIRTRLENGRLHEEHRGVYAVGHTVSTPYARLMSAVLAGGPTAAASGQGAAWLWDCGGPPALEVTVVGRGPRRRPGIRMHVVPALGPADRAVRHGIPCTDWPRMLRDLGSTASEQRLRRIVERLIMDGHFDLARLDVTRRPRLRAVLAAVEDEPDTARSGAEAALFAEFLRRELAEPRRNIMVAGHEWDFVWLRERYILELDSRWHQGPWRHQHDRRRDRDARDAGFVVDRVTVDDDPGEVAALVARRLAR
jgi:very-short-patch-repair endonuclease